MATDDWDNTWLGGKVEDLQRDKWDAVYRKTIKETLPDLAYIKPYTVADWRKALQAIENGEESGWRAAAAIFHGRIYGRYLIPIEMIQNVEGAGFAVMALDCLLLETLVAFKKGVLEAQDFGQEAKVFKNILMTDLFNFTDDQAYSFLQNIRNGILHGAETRNWTKIRTDGELVVGGDNVDDSFTINRKAFHLKMLAYYNDYREVVESGKKKSNFEDPKALRKTFLQKMNYIADPAYSLLTLWNNRATLERIRLGEGDRFYMHLLEKVDLHDGMEWSGQSDVLVVVKGSMRREKLTYTAFHFLLPRGLRQGPPGDLKKLLEKLAGSNNPLGWPLELDDMMSQVDPLMKSTRLKQRTFIQVDVGHFKEFAETRIRTLMRDSWGFGYEHRNVLSQ